MLNEQQKQTYAALLKKAQEAAKQEGKQILDVMHRVIDEASEKESYLAELTREELEAVKKMLKEDLNVVAKYFEEVGEGLEEILIMDAAYLEEKFLEISEKLADPTQLELLKLSLLASLKDAKK